MFGGGMDTKSMSLTDPSAFELFGGLPTVAGPAITPASALRVPAVYSAVSLIAGAIGALPAKVFASTDGSKSAAKDHPGYRLVHDEANDWTSAGKLRAQLTTDALLNGHGFAFANRVDDRVVEFIRLDPTSVTIKQDSATGEPVYVVGGNAGQRVYAYRDILHISAPLDVSPIAAGREAIGLAAILERHAAQLFASGARPSALFYNDNRKGGSDGSSGASIIKGIKAAYRAATGSGGFAEPMVLDDGWKYAQIALTSADAQFAEMRTEQVVEIARLFRVPPHLLFELSRATWSNAEEMFQSFLTLTLRSWMDDWEWAYARVLLAPDERAAGFYVEFVVDDLLTANAATRATTYQQYRAMGAMTANEVRSGLNLAPMDGGDTLANPNITPGKNESVSDSANDNATPRKEAA
jgi:HK97 family phage portal protein